MTTITTTNTNTAITTANSAAYEAAKANEFIQYMTRRERGTAKRQVKVISDFATWYAADRGRAFCDMMWPVMWKDVTAKDLTDYRLNLIYNDSFRTDPRTGERVNIGKKAINTINQEVSILCKFAKLAHAAGYIPDDHYNLIRDIEGIKPGEAIEIDKGRDGSRCNNAKKAAPVQLTLLQMELLKHDHPETLKGKRDQLFFCLLLDHGQRVGDMVNLTTANVDMINRTLTFKTQKTNCDMRLQMTGDVYRAFREYFAMWQPIQGGTIWTGVNKSDVPSGSFSKRAAQKMITEAAAKYGIENFSAHDCRHAWTDKALDAGNDVVTIQHAGGWKNLTMVSYYASKKEISNAGLKGFN
jgi:integrase